MRRKPLELISVIAAERVALHGQRFGLLLQLIKPRGRALLRGDQFAQPYVRMGWPVVFGNRHDRTLPLLDQLPNREPIRAPNHAASDKGPLTHRVAVDVAPNTARSVVITATHAT